ncbi:unnamed protein product [Lupinus luteus]|uniref:Cytochrome P450 n=1 Tax=Lupinus luteus TaxID=3873 RepID=A0AAV1WGB6_LUPLU
MAPLQRFQWQRTSHGFRFIASTWSPTYVEWFQSNQSYSRRSGRQASLMLLIPLGRYGHVFTIKLGSAIVLVVNNWESGKECFTINDLNVSYRPSILMTEHMTYNQGMFSFSPYGAYWREIRKMSNSGILSKNKVDLLSDIRGLEVKSSIQELFNLWSQKKDESNFMLVEMKQWFRELALNVIFHIAAGKKDFGGDATNNDKEAQTYIKTIRKFLRLIGTYTIADAIPLLRWLISAKNTQFSYTFMALI